MIGISIVQPAASLLALGPDVKVHHTVNWKLDYRGPALIYADPLWTSAEIRAFNEAIKLLGDVKKVPVLRSPQPTIAHALAIGNITDCRLVTGPNSAKPEHALDRAFGRWKDRNRFAIRFEDVVPLPEPVPMDPWIGWKELTVAEERLVMRHA